VETRDVQLFLGSSGIVCAAALDAWSDSGSASARSLVDCTMKRSEKTPAATPVPTCTPEGTFVCCVAAAPGWRAVW
jgi:hypothetical protein